jgi:hypothetical protein
MAASDLDQHAAALNRGSVLAERARVVPERLTGHHVELPTVPRAGEHQALLVERDPADGRVGLEERPQQATAGRPALVWTEISKGVDGTPPANYSDRPAAHVHEPDHSLFEFVLSTYIDSHGLCSLAIEPLAGRSVHGSQTNEGGKDLAQWINQTTLMSGIADRASRGIGADMSNGSELRSVASSRPESRAGIE